MHPSRFLLSTLMMLALLGGCDKPEQTGPVRVSVIGGAPTLADPNRKPLDEPQRVLTGAVAQGLVAFDENGQVEPALAQRWIVTNDGLSYIFRLRRAHWPGGKQVTTDEVARQLRAISARRSRNPLEQAFASVDEVAVMTPEVIELRLTVPRPPLLDLLAAPEAGIIWQGKGAGPFEIASREGGVMTLRPRRDEADKEGSAPAPEDMVALRGERAALSIARFMAGGSDLVLGGTFADWPVLQAANAPAKSIRIDPAEGLFGLVATRFEGFAADPENRRALAMAIDRDALLSTFGAPNWRSATAVLPQKFLSAADPAVPAWAGAAIADRRAAARARVSAWRNAHPGPLQVRIALPGGPGANLLFGLIAADWRRIGVEAVRAPEDKADFRLVDAVAPAGSAIWYLDMLACPSRDACLQPVTDLLDQARDATDLPARGAALAAADVALVNAANWIPIARPLRWSLVAARLDLFHENARAAHPLDRLRTAPEGER